MVDVCDYYVFEFECCDCVCEVFWFVGVEWIGMVVVDVVEWVVVCVFVVYDYECCGVFVEVFVDVWVVCFFVYGV